MGRAAAHPYGANTSVSLPRERFWDIQVPKIDSPTQQPLCSDRPAVITIPYCIWQLSLLVHYSIMLPTMTLRRVGCALSMPYITPYRPQFRPYNRAYAYQGLTTFASFSMAVSVRTCRMILLTEILRIIFSCNDQRHTIVTCAGYHSGRLVLLAPIDGHRLSHRR